MTTATVTKLTVLSTPSCQRCKAVARKLDDAGVDYDYGDLTEDAEWYATFKERGLSNVPQTVRGDTWVEGFDPDAIEKLF